MGSVLGLAVTVAAAAGAVAAYRAIERRGRAFSDILRKAGGEEQKSTRIIDCERDPETGVFRPR